MLQWHEGRQPLNRAGQVVTPPFTAQLPFTAQVSTGMFYTAHVTGVTRN